MSAQPAIDSTTFRRVMGQFSTGVTVVTVRRNDVCHGMTANSFTAVSLDPPLVLFCVGKTARMAAFIADAPGFVINILSAAQEAVSRQFAGSQRAAAQSVDLVDGPVAPIIANTLATISCATETIHEAGDHWIVVGRVIELREAGTSLAPLVFFRARYCQLLEPRVTQPERDPWANDALRIYHDEWSEGSSDVELEAEP